MKNNFSEPKNHRKLNISRPIFQKNGFFFQKNVFQGLGAFFTTAKSLIWASFFSTKN